jgi:hypothetical protein
LNSNANTNTNLRRKKIVKQVQTQFSPKINLLNTLNQIQLFSEQVQTILKKQILSHNFVTSNKDKYSQTWLFSYNQEFVVSKF